MSCSFCFSATGKVNGMTGRTKDKLQGGKKVRETGSTLSGEKELCQVSFILRKQWEEMHMHVGKAKHI